MRGYNQCEEIAKGIHSVTGIEIINKAVRRTHFTKSQTLLRGEERLQNVTNAFSLTHPELIRGKHILLIDDVITTGATLLSCARELAKSDNVLISVMTIGRTK